MQDETPAAFDAYDESYNDTVNRALAFSGLKVDYFTQVKMDYLMELIVWCGIRPEHSKAIDVGCGVANSHPLLAGRLAKLVGIDVSRSCLAKAAGRNPQNDYRCFDGRHVPYPDASFDVASAVCVFHHVPIADRATLARDVRRVLRSGGLFIVFEHNPVNPFTRLVVNHCEFDRDAVLLGRRETQAMLEEAGFYRVESRFILTVPAKGRLLRILDRCFARLPFGAQYYTVGRA